MNAVFLDTVGLIAIWDIADQWHQPASTAFAELLSAQRPFVTTALVLFECGNAAARRPYRTTVNQLRNAMNAAGNVVEPTPSEVEQAWYNYDALFASGAGIVDQISFLIMRRLGISQVFSNDRHFRVAGFETLF